MTEAASRDTSIPIWFICCMISLTFIWIFCMYQKGRNTKKIDIPYGRIKYVTYLHLPDRGSKHLDVDDFDRQPSAAGMDERIDKICRDLTCI